MMGGVRAFFWLWLCAWAALYRWQAGRQYDHAHAAYARGDALETKAVATRMRADAVRQSKAKQRTRNRGRA